MDNTTQNVLQNLRDIHYPAPVSWWPLAPGWYIVMGLIALVSFALGAWLYRRQLRARRRRFILEQLQKLQAMQAKKPDSPRALIEVSALLKRVALAQYPRQEVAGLKGEAWLKFLDRSGHTDAFSNGAGRLLITAPYQKQVPDQAMETLRLAETWIKQRMKYYK